MNNLYPIALVLFLFSSCSTEVVSEKDDQEQEGSVEIQANEAEEVKEDKVFLFESTDEGVKEFMRCTELPNGKKQWVYSTVKNPREVKLGSRVEAGFEVVYFYSNPEELYWVYGSECGFTLSNDTKRTSQWYSQVQPNCADEPF